MAANTHRLLPIAVLLLCLGMGCGCGEESKGSTDASSSSCDGPPPRLDACFIGGFFADCGGAGSPALACHENGDCRWFTGGCVAAEYETAPCPANNVCCEDNWPFVGATNGELSLWLLGWGREPWDRARETSVDVAVDEETSASVAFNCNGTDPYDDPAQTPCSGWAQSTAGGTSGDTFVILPDTEGQFGWMPVIEIDPESPDGTAKARICMYPYEDTVDFVCKMERERECAATGLLTLSSLPNRREALGGMVGLVNATFSTFELEGSFVVVRSRSL
jgi:hypothetical protein